ncbi:hypothetical protein P278_09590 [Zhouia amylolytica AD3]|uniref:Uncharacterized protein n=1 Tax=Zhouia amylolytica AD3 TaxID=1286632 RepID=W2US19_9FLAO|nr:hypothetical protein P278_09590 [Zhouia amylolytica AD3]
MEKDLNEFFENKLENLPLYMRYIQFKEKNDNRIEVIHVEKHNTTKYKVRPFYRPLQPLKL